MKQLMNNFSTICPRGYFIGYAPLLNIFPPYGAEGCKPVWEKSSMHELLTSFCVKGFAFFSFLTCCLGKLVINRTRGSLVVKGWSWSETRFLTSLISQHFLLLKPKITRNVEMNQWEWVTGHVTKVKESLNHWITKSSLFIYHFSLFWGDNLWSQSLGHSKVTWDHSCLSSPADLCHWDVRPAIS